MKLLAVVTGKGYRAPRWATAKQFFEKGYHIKGGEYGTICEKSIFEKGKRTKDEHGNIMREVVQLNWPMGGAFGSEEYAKEELRAEIGALFTEADLGISLKGERYEDHSDYLRSWIGVLQNDYNEFFRACADAELISKRLSENYTRKYELKMEVEGLPDIRKEEPAGLNEAVETECL